MFDKPTKSNKPTTNCAIYGYRKDPENKYHWLIDEEAAAVVRRIFRLTIEGKGPYDIARILFEDKVETPAVYFGKQGKGIWKSKEEFSNPYNWSGYVVGQILSKPEYMGHTVNFRSHKQSYKDKNAVMNPKEDWLIFEDTHEAIVDRETWELAQKLRKTPKRIDTLGEANPLTGLLYCADCGEKMYNHRSKGGTENNPYPSDFFDCSSYTLAHQKRTAACCGHYITTKALRTLILDTIRTVSTFAISNQAAFMEKVRSASQLRQAEAAKDAKRRLSKDKKRIAELDTIIKKSQTQDVGELFESLVNMVQKIHGSVWSPETFDTLRKISEDPNGKWAHYVQRLLRERFPWLDPKTQVVQRLPDQAVALGCALFAERPLADRKVRFAYAIKAYRGNSDEQFLYVCIPMNCTLPCSVSGRFSTRLQEQDNVALKIFEVDHGAPLERIPVKEGRFTQLIARHSFGKPVPKGTSVLVTTELSKDGLLTLTVDDGGISTQGITRHTFDIVRSLDD